MRLSVRGRGILSKLFRESALFVALLGLLTGELAARGSGIAAEWWRGMPPGAVTARGAIVAMLGAELTALGIMLSLGIVLYQSVSGQYSPRLVAVLVRSSGVQRSVRLLAFACAYSLGALHGIGLFTQSKATYGLVVGLGFGLFTLSAATLIFEIGRLIVTLRPERVAARISKETDRAIARVDALFGEWEMADGAPAPRDAASGRVLVAPLTGYIKSVDSHKLRRAAARRRLHIELDKWTGDYVLVGAPIGWVRGALSEAEACALSRAFIEIGRSREIHFDPLYGVRLLAEIADRALSPAINDPFTAVQALHAAQGPLRQLARAPRGPLRLMRDGRELARVAAPLLDEYMRLTVDGPIRYGVTDPDLLAAVRELAWAVDSTGQAAAQRVARQVSERVSALPAGA